MKRRGIALAAVLALVLTILAGGALADAWVCPVCGQTGNTGFFCPNCGNPAPAEESWTCAVCGLTGNTGYFCTYCGAGKPQETEPSLVNPYLEQIPGQTDRVKVSVDTVDASSYIKNGQEPTRWLPVNAADGDESTCWQYSWKKNQYLILYLAQPMRVDEVWFKNGFWAVNDKGADQFGINARLKKVRLEYLYSGESVWRDPAEWTLESQRTSWQSIPTRRTENIAAIRMTVLSIYNGSYYKNDVCLSEIMPVQYAPADTAMPPQAAKAPRVYESRPDVTGVGLKMELSTRSGPNTKYTGAGNFFPKNYKDVTVRVLRKAQGNGVWWVQVDFDYNSYGRYRVWTGLKRVDVNLDRVRDDTTLGNGTVRATTNTRFGPGGNYADASKRITIKQDADMIVYARENGWLDIEFWYTNDTSKTYRIWVPESDCYGIYWSNDNSGEN